MKPGVAIVSCNDGLRPVIMKLEATDEECGAVILIAPESPLEISRVHHDPNVMQRIYDIGRKAGETANLRELSQFKRCMEVSG